MYRRITAIAPMLIVTAITAAPTTQKSPDELFQELRQNLKREHEASLKDLSDLGEKKIDNLIELKREGDMLRIESKIEATNEPVRFTLMPRGLLGRADLRSQNGMPGPVVTAQIEFNDFSQPGDVQRNSSLFIAPTTLNISSFVSRTLGEFSVQYLQSRDAEDISVKLIVQEESDLGTQDHSITCEASSFAELREKHGREVQRYLAPILRDAGLEQAAFAPSLVLAQQALGVGAEIDTKAVESIEPLLVRLESPDFKTRRKAKVDLKALDRSLVLALARTDRSKWSLDRIAAVDSLLAESEIPSTAEVAALGKSAIFLIDCLYLDDPVVRKAAVLRLETLKQRPLNIKVDEPLPKRVLTIDRLVDQFIEPMRVETDDK